MQKYLACNKCLNNPFFIEESEDSTLDFIMFCVYMMVIPFEF